MSSPATSYPPPVTRPDDEVLVRVDGVSKKFCRSLKKSLWYWVCDIAGELLPGRKRQRVTSSELLVAGGAEEAVTSNELRVTSENHSAAGADTRHSPPVTRHSAAGDSGLATRHQLPATRYLADRRSFASGRRVLGGAGYFVRAPPRGIEDLGTVRKRDFEEMPWCNQGAGLREETASTVGDYRAEWGGAQGARTTRLRTADWRNDAGEPGGVAAAR